MMGTRKTHLAPHHEGADESSEAGGLLGPRKGRGRKRA